MCALFIRIEILLCRQLFLSVISCLLTSDIFGTWFPPFLRPLFLFFATRDGGKKNRRAYDDQVYVQYMYLCRKIAGCLGCCYRSRTCLWANEEVAAPEPSLQVRRHRFDEVHDPPTVKSGVTLIASVRSSSLRLFGTIVNALFRCYWGCDIRRLRVIRAKDSRKRTLLRDARRLLNKSKSLLFKVKRSGIRCVFQ